MRRFYGFTESISNNIYRCEIWDSPNVYINDYQARVEADGGIVESIGCIGAALPEKELRMASPGFTLIYNQQGGKLWEDHIQTSKVKASFVVDDPLDHAFFQQLAVDYEGEYALVVFKNDVLIYIGRVISDQMQYERRPELNSVYTITAVDSLALLDNFKVKRSWFNSSTLRLNILDLIRLSIAETYVQEYYDLFGFTNNYMMDLSKDLPTGSPGHMKILEINMSSTVKNLNNFINFNDGDDIFLDTKSVIENLLLVTHSKLIYSNGYFIIYDPVTIAENNFLYAFVYSTAGTYISRPTINTQYIIGNANRPCFEAFPVHTHQPAQLRIEQTYQRKAFSFDIRTFSNQSTSPLTLRHKSVGAGALAAADGINVNAVISFASQSFVGVPPKQSFAEINFRIYVDGGASGYRHYSYQTQTWSAFTGSLPFYEKVRCEVTDYQVISSTIATFTVDFNRNFKSPASGDEVVVEFLVGNIAWNWATGSVFNALSIWGGAQIYEQDAAPRKHIGTNSKNPKATEVLDVNAVYGYNFSSASPNGIGTIWNSATGNPSDVTLDDWVRRQMAVYVNAPKVAQAVLVDDGDYYALLCPNFDDDSYIFNGGTFDAQSETWDFELLKIASDVVNVDTSELDYQDEVDINDQQNNAISRIIQQVEKNRESVSNLPNSLPYDVMRVSPDTPIVAPTVTTNFAPIINYSDSTEDLTWNIRELGKVQSLIGGTHDLDPTCELIICDASAESVIINLPDPATVKGLKYHFKKISSSNQVQLNGTIDGVGVYSFNGKDDCKVIMSDGTAYWLVSYYHK